MTLIKNITRISLSLGICLFVNQAGAQDVQADNMLLFQRANGGWSKQYHGKAFSYGTQFSDSLKKDIAIEASHNDANIDNESTKKEIRYLVAAYNQHHNTLYLKAAERGIRFLLDAQYKNGGFPQYHPDHSGYRGQVTFNDNAMINALNVLQDVALKENGFGVVDASLVPLCADAVKRGIDCIVKTQIKTDGKLTGWCQQYDEVSLKPAKARAYELPSVSGSETVGIVNFLMRQQNPTADMKAAINAAAAWLDAVKITGYKIAYVDAPGTTKGRNKELVADANAPAMWARYYEIGTNKPFFCDRDGIKKYAISEIGYERRNGYAWYGNWAQNLLTTTYPAWKAKWG